MQAVSKTSFRNTARYFSWPAKAVRRTASEQYLNGNLVGSGLAGHTTQRQAQANDARIASFPCVERLVDMSRLAPKPPAFDGQ